MMRQDFIEKKKLGCLLQNCRISFVKHKARSSRRTWFASLSSREYDPWVLTIISHKGIKRQEMLKFQEPWMDSKECVCVCKFAGFLYQSYDPDWLYITGIEPCPTFLRINPYKQCSHSVQSSEITNKFVQFSKHMHCWSQNRTASKE